MMRLEDDDMLFFGEPQELRDVANEDLIGTIKRVGNYMSISSINVRSKDKRDLRTEEDIVAARAMVKRVTALLGFSLVNQTKAVTAASEIARNTVEYGLGGTIIIEVLDADGRSGVRLIFEDNGPGIADIDEALQDGFTSGSGMGLGLGGSKRLMDDFSISSEPGAGTTITMTKWG